MEDLEEEDDTGSTGASQAELLREYLGFARSEIAARWRVSAAIVAIGITLTVAVAVYWPRTYVCSTVLMALGTTVLDTRDGTNALAGASDLIMRNENLEGLVRDVGLIEKASRRPPILRLKDRLIVSLFGEMNEKTKVAALLGTLEQKIDVSTEKGDLTIKVEWSDPFTASDIAGAARESFVKARHNAEMSAFDEKMSILEGHATKLRDEVGTLAEQLRAARDKQLAEARDKRAQANKASAAPDAPAVQVVRRTIEPDAQLPELRDKLSTLKAKLAVLEADRDRRLREEQAKFEEMKLRLTPSHPEVVTEGERVAMLSQVPSDVALMRAEMKDLEGLIQQREGFARQGSEFGVRSAGASRNGTPDLLPPDITDLLERDNLDPALSAQLSGAVTKYGSLRGDILSTKIDLDTAEAAFGHRYQIIVPAEPPNKPSKPKVGAIVAGGLLFSLLIAVALPILAGLRSGIMTDRWQVQHLQLPVLAELRLPPHSSD